MEAPKTREELTELLYTKAKQVATGFQTERISTEDLVQETMLDLVPFINSYQVNDYEDIRPYAYGAVKNGMKRAYSILVRSRGIGTMPYWERRSMKYVIGTKSNMEKRLGYVPDASSIAEEMRISVAMCCRMLGYNDMLFPRSFDEPLYNDADETLASFIPCGAEGQPEWKMYQIDLRDQINRVLKTLEPLEEMTIRLRFGFINDEEFSPKEVAAELKIPFDVEQLTEIKAIRKLRHPSRSKYLEPYLYST